MRHPLPGFFKGYPKKFFAKNKQPAQASPVHLTSTPQPSKKLQASGHKTDSNGSCAAFAFNLLDHKEALALELEKELAATHLLTEEKAKLLQSLELKIFKLEKDLLKKKKELDDGCAQLKAKEKLLEDALLREFEAKIEVDSLAKKLELLDKLADKATKAFERLDAENKRDLEAKVKSRQQLLQDKDKQTLALQLCSKLLDQVWAVFLELDADLGCLEDAKFFFARPELIFEAFFDRCEKDLLSLFDASQDFFADLADQTDSKPPPAATASLKAMRCFESLRQLARTFCESKVAQVSPSKLREKPSKPPPSTVRLLKSRDSLLNSLSRSNLPQLEGHLFSKDRDVSAQLLELSSDRRLPLDAQANPPGLRAARYSFAALNTYHLDDDSAILEKEQTVNDSQIDTSYLQIVDNVFLMMENLFLRIKNHCRSVYQDCIAVLEADQADSAARLKQQLERYSRVSQQSRASRAAVQLGQAGHQRPARHPQQLRGRHHLLHREDHRVPAGRRRAAAAAAELARRLGLASSIY